MQIVPTIKDEMILQWLALEDASEDTKQHMIAQVRDITDIRFAGVIAELLGEAKLDEFEAVKAQGATVQYRWLKDAIPQIEELYRAAMQDVATDIKNSVEDMLT